MKYLGIAIVVVAMAASVVCAQNLPQIDERVVNLQSPPVKVTNIHAGWPPPEWASEPHKTNQPEPKFLPLYLQAQNTTDKAIYAYKLKVVVYDPFGDYMDTMCATAVVGGLAAQAKDYGRWSLPTRMPVLTSTIVVYLEAVRYQDGSAWVMDPVGVASLFPSTAAVRFHSWHIVPDAREVILQVPKDVG